MHRNYEDVFGEVVAAAKSHLPEGHSYTVVKVNGQTGAVSFIESADFDVAPEPTVGDAVTVAADGKLFSRERQRDPYIYHHKWLFVRDDYQGFDVQESKQRSLATLALSGVDRTRIGRKSYWEANVLPRLK